MANPKHSTATDSPAGRKDAPAGPVTAAGLRWAALAVFVLAVAGVYFYWPQITGYFSGGEEAAPEQEEQAPTVGERLRALEEEANRSNQQEVVLENRVAELERRLRTIEAGGAGDGQGAGPAVAARLEALERELGDLQETLGGGGAAAMARAFEYSRAVAGLAAPLFSSRPFEAELEQVRALAQSYPALEQAALAGPLETLSRGAASGIPSMASLHQDFDRLALDAIRAGALPEDAGWWDKVWARIKGLVVVRRIDGEGSAPAELVLREVEAHLVAGRLAEAVDLVSALPPAQAEVFAPWLTRAQERMQALAAYRKLAAGIPEAGNRTAP